MIWGVYLLSPGEIVIITKHKKCLVCTIRVLVNSLLYFAGKTNQFVFNEKTISI
jgi:hypothetical protein